MKLKMALRTAGVLIWMAFYYEAFGSVGSGVRGGGHVIDVNSTPYLMDLVSKSVCDWKKGAEFITELPSLRETLKKIESIDWYFAADLADEISHLNFCMTGPLYQAPAYQHNSVVIREKGERLRQAGYRLYDSAYIDSDIFARMNDVSKSMLIIHETLHTYLSMFTFDRALKLRSIVKTIDLVRQGEINSREKLHYAMEMNEIIFPLTVGILDKKKNAITFLKSSINYKIEVLLKIKKPEELIDLIDNQIQALAPWDQDYFGDISTRVQILSEALVATMQKLSPLELKIFLIEKEVKNINLAQIALNNFYSFSEEQKSAILASESFNKMIKSGFDDILTEKFEITDALITTSVKFQQFVTGHGFEITPVVRLSKATTLPTKLNWLVESMIIFHENNTLAAITSSEAFYRALGLKNQKEQVVSIPVKIPREKSVALKKLSHLSQVLVSTLLNAIEQRVPTETYQDILKQIDFKKL